MASPDEHTTKRLRSKCEERNRRGSLKLVIIDLLGIEEMMTWRREFSLVDINELAIIKVR
jgi:hypothetical protein